MTLQLDDQLLCGELAVRSPWSLHGWLRLRGTNRLLLVQLTGRCPKELIGRRIRFDSPSRRETAVHPAPSSEFAWFQIGPIERISVSRTAEAKREPSATTEARPRKGLGLWLEWRGQNGHVALRLPTAGIEILDDRSPRTHDANDETPAIGDEADDLDPLLGNDFVDELDDDPLLNALVDLGDLDEPVDGESPPGVIGDPGFWERVFQAEDFPCDMKPLEPSEDSLDGWNLSPADTAYPPDSVPGDDAPPRDDAPRWGNPAEEHEPAVPLTELFDRPVRLPRPERLDDTRAETTLRQLLGELARFGVSILPCEHLGPLEVYRLLVEEICPRELALPELRGTQWVRTISTSDYCPHCRAQAARDAIFDREEPHHRPDDPWENDLRY